MANTTITSNVTVQGDNTNNKIELVNTRSVNIYATSLPTLKIRNTTAGAHWLMRVDNNGKLTFTYGT